MTIEAQSTHCLREQVLPDQKTKLCAGENAQCGEVKTIYSDVTLHDSSDQCSDAFQAANWPAQLCPRGKALKEGYVSWRSDSGRASCRYHHKEKWTAVCGVLSYEINGKCRDINHGLDEDAVAAALGSNAKRVAGATFLLSMRSVTDYFSKAQLTRLVQATDHHSADEAFVAKVRSLQRWILQLVAKPSDQDLEEVLTQVYASEAP
jgi:hypothetical protein